MVETMARKMGFYEKYIKRIQDLLISVAALILLCPIMCIIALLIRLKLGSPVIFRQVRPGLDEKPFVLYKFRTMADERASDGRLLPDNERLAKFGSFLRATSLDELPELWNIVRGDMALIGPRPLLVQYLPLYDDHQKRRHEVKPGLSGYAQVNGRNTISWDDKFKLDIEYVDNISFIMDWRIIFLTIAKVLSRKDINSSTEVTMEPFTGSTQKHNDTYRL